MKNNEVNDKAGALRSLWVYPAMLLFLVPSVLWILRDHNVWPWDPSWYGEVTVRLWFTLSHQAGDWWPALMTAFHVKAPGIAWLGQFFVPLGAWLGSIEPALLCSVLAVQAASLLLVYKLGTEYAPKRPAVALAGVLVLASAPLFVAMSHQYFVEPLQLLGVTYFYLLAATARKLSRVSLLGHLLVATAIVLLAKASSPIYCLLPGLMAAGALFERHAPAEGAPLKPSLWSWLRLAAGGALLAGCALWYWRNFSEVRSYVGLVSSGEVALDCGTPGTFPHKLLFWLRSSQHCFQLPAVLLGEAVLLALAAVLVWRRHNRGAGKPAWVPRHLTLLAGAALIHIAAVLTIFSLNINEENRYLLPLLPAIATLTVWCLAQAPVRWMPLALAALLLCQWAAVCAQALGLRPRSAHMSWWLAPYKADAGAMSEVTELVRRTSGLPSPQACNVVGIELPGLNANTLAFYAEKARVVESRAPASYISLGYAQRDIARAMARCNSPQVACFISIEEAAQPAPPNFLNQTALPVLHRIREDKRFVQEPFQSQQKIVLFRRQEIPLNH